jgi:peptidoglycan/xylan/chitin deacetylase (PgdA/CDA1 family)
MNSISPGNLVISLDFELHWGVRDILSVEQYHENLKGAREVIPKILDLFAEYSIHATWATVGFLFLRSKSELLRFLPSRLPTYEDPKLSPYLALQEIGDNEEDAPFYYAKSLIDSIRRSPNQEIGTHTFSHYLCMAAGQSPAAFDADLKAAICVASESDIELRSLVFPRNQYDGESLEICKRNGIRVFRGNPASWFYSPDRDLNAVSARLKRPLRLIDAYINLDGMHGYTTRRMPNALIDLPGSRFLRPWSKRLQYLDPLRLRRMSLELQNAAEKGLNYHVWWHPHNFGTNQTQNLSFLRRFLELFREFQSQHGMQSKNMGEFVTDIS